MIKRVLFCMLLALFCLSYVSSDPSDPLGACAPPLKVCSITSQSLCPPENFHKTFLCTAPALATSCQPTSDTIIIGDRKHFRDSCGNPGNLYFVNSTPITVESYWTNILFDAKASDIAAATGKASSPSGVSAAEAANDTAVPSKTSESIAAKSSGSSKILIYAVIIAVVLVAAGFYFYFKRKQ